MDRKEFGERLNKLRQQKDVTAREMSLSLGRNAGYICEIETNEAMPSMGVFFYICEYLGITPKDFFDVEVEAPVLLADLMKYLRRLNPKQIEHLKQIVMDMLGLSQIGRERL